MSIGILFRVTDFCFEFVRMATKQVTHILPGCMGCHWRKNLAFWKFLSSAYLAYHFVLLQVQGSFWGWQAHVNRCRPFDFFESWSTSGQDAPDDISYDQQKNAANSKCIVFQCFEQLQLENWFGFQSLDFGFVDFAKDIPSWLGLAGYSEIGNRSVFASICNTIYYSLIFRLSGTWMNFICLISLVSSGFLQHSHFLSLKRKANKDGERHNSVATFAVHHVDAASGVYGCSKHHSYAWGWYCVSGPVCCHGKSEKEIVESWVDLSVWQRRS